VNRYAAYAALVHRRAAAELLLLLLPFALLKLAAAVWVRFGRIARGETNVYLVPSWSARASSSDGRGLSLSKP
jgi:hypothetical protein